MQELLQKMSTFTYRLSWKQQIQLKNHENQPTASKVRDIHIHGTNICFNFLIKLQKHSTNGSKYSLYQVLKEWPRLAISSKMFTHCIFVWQKVLPDSEEILSELTKTFHKPFLQKICVTYILMMTPTQAHHTIYCMFYFTHCAYRLFFSPLLINSFRNWTFHQGLKGFARVIPRIMQLKQTAYHFVETKILHYQNNTVHLLQTTNHTCSRTQRTATATKPATGQDPRPVLYSYIPHNLVPLEPLQSHVQGNGRWYV
jgi:hypothetical protein